MLRGDAAREKEKNPGCALGGGERSTGRLRFWGLIGSERWAELKYCWRFKRCNYVTQSICLMFLTTH